MTETQTQTNEDVRVYELGYHVVPTIPEAALDDAVAEIRTAIEKNGGSFITEASPEGMDLAYPMQVSEEGKRTTYTRAYFGWIKFEMTGEGVQHLDEALAANKSVLRFVLFATVREDTRAQIEDAANILQEVETKGTLERKVDSDLNKKGEEVSDVELDRSIDELTGDVDATATDDNAQDKTDTKEVPQNKDDK